MYESCSERKRTKQYGHLFFFLNITITFTGDFLGKHIQEKYSNYTTLSIQKR